MEAALRLLTKEALKDNNFGQTFFENGNPDEDKVISKSDLAKTNRMHFRLFTRHSELKIRKQYKDTKSFVGKILTVAVEEYDGLMTGMHLDPLEDKKGADQDKIFKAYPSFDPVFMKV